MKSDLTPTVYCASPLHRAAMWRDRSIIGPRVNVISTWHDNLSIEKDQYDERACALGWRTNIYEIIHNADHLIAYAEFKDRPEGTMVEIGAALARHLPVVLVGNYPWGTWRYHHGVVIRQTLREAADWIADRSEPNDPSKG